MPSADQLAANIANAQKPTGPTTQKGKHRTRLNAVRHGLTGQLYLFTAEEQPAFDAHCKGIHESLKPVGALEIDITQGIAEDRWRLNRARALESGIFAFGQHKADDCDTLTELHTDEAFSQARTWLNRGKELQLLALYEQRIHRGLEKNMAQLRTLQAERKAAHQQALDEAQLLAQLATMKGEKYDPSQDFPSKSQEIGSDFSTAGINRQIARSQRLTEARHYAKNAWDPKTPSNQPSFPLPKAA
jgi:hypothetical protein